MKKSSWKPDFEQASEVVGESTTRLMPGSTPHYVCSMIAKRRSTAMVVGE